MLPSTNMSVCSTAEYYWDSTWGLMLHCPPLCLQKVTELSWVSSTRLIVHFGDMPCHGGQYYSDDTYPGGNPDGLVPEEWLKTMCMNRIDYHFARITR